MPKQLSTPQAALLVGGFLLLMGLLVLAAYVVHKAFQRRREETDLPARTPRLKDETAVMLASLQGVITRMKAQEKALQELVRVAEKTAQESERLSKAILLEIPWGVMVFDRQGFVTHANPAVRTLLGIDIWSRRRYAEIFGPQSPLAVWVRECLEVGKTYRRESTEWRPARGENCTLEISLLPLRDQKGVIEGALCLFSVLAAGENQ